MTDVRRALSPSMMCANYMNLESDIRQLEALGVGSLHLDIMDGKFVPNLAMSPSQVRQIGNETNLELHAHLMVEAPGDYVDRLAHDGVDVFMFHLEATRYPIRLMAEIRDRGMTPCVCLNPATPVGRVIPLLPLECVLVMTVEPGFAGQPFIANSVARVKELRSICGPETRLVVDGAIGPDTGPPLRDAGANTFVCGTSSIFRDDGDYESGATEFIAALEGI